MKKILGLCLIVGLGGCVSPATQMINNNFLDINTTEPEVVGIWTAAVGPGLSTIKLSKNGTGMMCEDDGRNVSVYRVKNSNNLIYTQNGMSLKKISIASDLLNLKTTFSAFNVDIKYKGDNNLQLASPRCAKEITQ